MNLQRSLSLTIPLCPECLHIFAGYTHPISLLNTDTRLIGQWFSGLPVINLLGRVLHWANFTTTAPWPPVFSCANPSTPIRWWSQLFDLDSNNFPLLHSLSPVTKAISHTESQKTKSGNSLPEEGCCEGLGEGSTSFEARHVWISILASSFSA